MAKQTDSRLQAKTGMRIGEAHEVQHERTTYSGATHKPKVHPLATSSAVTDSKINAMVMRAKKVTSKDRLEMSTTMAAAANAMAADPYAEYRMDPFVSYHQ